MIDTHAHINTKEYDNRIEEVISNAKDKGLSNIIAVGMDLATSKRAINLSDKYDMVYATVGIHPSYVDGSDHTKLDHLYNNKKVVAVGEIGLDFYWTTENKELQIKIFTEQIEKAIKLDLPIIVHARDSFDDVYNILSRYKGKVKGVLHCFTGTIEEAFKTIDLGLYIGIDGPVTFKNAKELHELVRLVPLSKILVETDSPYLTPAPFRGKKNEPSYVVYVVEEIAKLKQITKQEVIDQTTKNAIELFRLGE